MQKLVMALVLWVATPLVAHGQTLTAVWDPNPPGDQVTQYEVCIGTTSLSCNFQRPTVLAPEHSYEFTPAPGVLYYVAVRAIGAAGVGEYSQEITISIPGLTQPANQTSTVNTPIAALSLTASDPDGGSIRFSHTGLPFGLSLNSSTGVITGTPTTTGTFTVTVFVTDGLATTSRSFGWNVQPPGAPDTSAPSLTISSHSAGQTVTSSSITLSGSATDSGTGGTGIASVTVNGASASGGTATGSNTANWSRSVALVTGANVLTVVARDGANNTSTTQITINRISSDTIAPALAITSHTSGQTVATSTFTLAGTATDSGRGGSGITSVTVNGTAAIGGTATGSNTANWSRTVTLSAGANVLTVSARDGANNLRTVSITLTYTPPAALLTVNSVTPSAGSGTTATFALQYGDSLGITDLATARLRIGATLDGVGSCTVSYRPSTQTVSILNDAATAWLTGALGSGTLQNSQCTVQLASSTASVSGTTLTVTVTVTFNTNFRGTKNLYMLADNQAGISTGWQQRGTWTPAATATMGTPSIAAGSVSPSSGSGQSGMFVLQYSDSFGAQDLATARVRFAATLDNVGSCTVSYSPATGFVSLLNDAGTVWLAGALGSGTLSNSQCTVQLDNSSASMSGAALTVTLAVTFNASFSGTKNIYMLAESTAGLSTGWQRRGTWTPTAPLSGTSRIAAVSVSPNTGTGTSGTFVMLYTDSFGAQDLATARVRFAATLNSVGSCTVSYRPATGLLSLLDDAAGAWETGALGSGTLQNSQCTVLLAGSTATISGTTLTLRLSVMFSASFRGAKNIYLLAENNAGDSTMWHQLGTWTNP